MQCKECGAQNSDSGQYCVECGAPLLVSEGQDFAEGSMGQVFENTVSIRRLQKDSLGFKGAVMGKAAYDNSSGNGSGKRTSVYIGVVIGTCAIIAIVVLATILLPQIAGKGDDGGLSSSQTGVMSVESSNLTVSYYGSGATDGSMSSETYKSGSSITIPSCGFVYDNHVFVRWEDDQGIAYRPGDIVTITSDLELAAVWEAKTYEVKFLGAGADGGSTSSIFAEAGVDIVLPSCGFYRNGYEFDRWAGESGATYRPGDAYRVQGDATFAAQWVSKTGAGETTSESVQSPSNSSSSLSASSLPRNWRGTYEGWSDYTDDNTITRAVYISLNEVLSSGTLEGKCSIGVSEDAQGATHGSYAIRGFIDWQTGEIQLYGTHWIDQGGLIGMGRFEGTVNPSSWTIQGQWFDLEDEANPGAWYMSAS